MHEKQVEIGYLLDFYGELLNERKRGVLDLYYNEDMSLSEIASDFGITRQGVLDLIKKGGSELLTYEEKLGVARKFRVISEKVAQIQEMVVSPEDKKAEISSLLMQITETMKD